jgi:hypothetical protein
LSIRQYIVFRSLGSVPQPAPQPDQKSEKEPVADKEDENPKDKPFDPHPLDRKARLYHSEDCCRGGKHPPGRGATPGACIVFRIFFHGIITYAVIASAAKQSLRTLAYANELRDCFVGKAPSSQ